jgi:hypothetical protein
MNLFLSFHFFFIFCPNTPPPRTKFFFSSVNKGILSAGEVGQQRRSSCLVKSPAGKFSALLQTESAKLARTLCAFALPFL